MNKQYPYAFPATRGELFSQIEKMLTEYYSVYDAKVILKFCYLFCTAVRIFPVEWMKYCEDSISLSLFKLNHKKLVEALMKESALDKLSDSKRIDPYSFLLPLSYQVAVYTKSISDSFAFLHRLDMKKRLTPDELTRREFSDALKCAQIVIREYRDASSDQFPLSSAKELVREFSLMYQQLPDKSDALTMFH